MKPQADQPIVGAVRESNPDKTIELEVVPNQVGDSSIQGIPWPALGIERNIPERFHEQTCSLSQTYTQNDGIVE